MINVIASIYIREGKINGYVQILKALVPVVRNEQGCIEYLPAGDMGSGLAMQTLDKDVVTIIEKWASLEALQAHNRSPHMLVHREKVKDMVDHVSIKVLRELE
jgi:quinol monooxygenase YgiN